MHNIKLNATVGASFATLSTFAFLVLAMPASALLA